jgi:hypothetical protein
MSSGCVFTYYRLGVFMIQMLGMWVVGVYLDTNFCVFYITAGGCEAGGCNRPFTITELFFGTADNPSDYSFPSTFPAVFGNSMNTLDINVTIVDDDVCFIVLMSI